MSRNWNDLEPKVRQAIMLVKEKFDAHGDAVLLVTSTYRSLEEQSRLFRQGRKYSKIQEKAKELEFQWHRPDLAKILLGVEPQYGEDVVTNSGPGQSLHNYRLAVDCAIMRNGKFVWVTKMPADIHLWKLYGECAVEAGLEWGGNWQRFKDYPHVQLPGVRWQDLIVKREVRTVKA